MKTIYVGYVQVSSKNYQNSSTGLAPFISEAFDQAIELLKVSGGEYIDHNVETINFGGSFDVYVSIVGNLDE